MVDYGNAPLSAAGLQLAFRRLILPAWFLFMDVIYVHIGAAKIGVDAALYTDAAAAWLRGADPYAVELTGVPFGAAPPALLVYAPFTLMPDLLVRPFWIVLGIAAGLWTLRRLGLPWWWMAFPPMVGGIIVGNAQPVVLALLMAGGTVPTFVAAAAKLYAVIPALAGGLRPLLWTAAGLAVTAPFLPWSQFLANGGYVDRLTGFAWNGSATAFGSGFVALTVVGLLVIGRRSAPWLAIPAVWPATQTYYAVFALPVLTPLLAALVAVPIPGNVPVAVLLVAVTQLGIARKVLPARWTLVRPWVPGQSLAEDSPRHLIDAHPGRGVAVSR